MNVLIFARISWWKQLRYVIIYLNITWISYYYANTCCEINVPMTRQLSMSGHLHARFNIISFKCLFLLQYYNLFVYLKIIWKIFKINNNIKKYSFM